MNQAFQTYQGIVYPWHCDHMGHMSVMHYAGKFDEAGWALFARLGLGGKVLRDGQLGFVPVEQTIRYRGELMAGDSLIITSRVTDHGAKSITFRHEMHNSEQDYIAAETTVTALYFDRKARQSIALPDRIREKLAAIL